MLQFLLHNCTMNCCDGTSVAMRALLHVAVMVGVWKECVVFLHVAISIPGFQN